MTVGEKIRYYREKEGLSTIQLATSAGLPVDNIRKYESGARNPKIEPLKKIATALGININTLLDVELKTPADVAPYLLRIGQSCGIEFIGNKNKDGLYSNDISIRFKDQYIQEFLARWANRLETIRNLRNEAEHTLDKDTKAYMLKRADDMESSMEADLADSIPFKNTPDGTFHANVLTQSISDMLTTEFNKLNQ